MQSHFSENTGVIKWYRTYFGLDLQNATSVHILPIRSTVVHEVLDLNNKYEHRSENFIRLESIRSTSA